MRKLALLSIASLALVACGGSSDLSPASPAPRATSPEVASESTAEASGTDEMGRILNSGFGQRDEYVWVTAIVENLTETVGHTVTVSFNVLDDDGQILATETQVEGFSLPQAEHIIGTQVTLAKGETAADLEVSLDVQDENLFGDTPFTAVTASETTIESNSVGGPGASLELTNNTSENVANPRVQTACFDAAGQIIGGGSEYPEFVPAQGRIKVDLHLIVSEEPTSCASFVGSLGDGGSAPGEDLEKEAAAGSAAEAFEVWIEQFNAKDWTSHYASLVNAQRDLISEDEYVACRESEETPTFSWLGVIDETEVKNYFIPGAAGTVSATKVTANLKFEGMTVPIDAHMIDEDGQWKWSMTEENLSGCIN